MIKMSQDERSIQIQKIYNLLLNARMTDETYEKLHDILNEIKGENNV